MKFIAIVRQEVSRNSFSLFLPLLPRTLFNLVPAKRVSISVEWMKILRREVKEGQDDKVIPSGSRFDLSNSYDEQEKSNGDRMIDNDVL